MAYLESEIHCEVVVYLVECGSQEIQVLILECWPLDCNKKMTIPVQIKERDCEVKSPFKRNKEKLTV